MNRFNKIIVLLFIFLFMLSLTITASAETYNPNNYTSVGDSIAYGMSASQGNGYVDLFYNYLKNQEGNSEINEYNLAVPGTTSSDLLTKLSTDTNIQDAIKNAKVITISVGGNNLLSPIIAAACQAFQVDPKSPTLVKDLGDKINAASDKATLIQGIITSPALQSALTSGTVKFRTDWPQIVAAVKALSPNAKLYALTIYNPISKSDLIYSPFDQIVQLLNSAIVAGGSSGTYNIVDVYTAFKQYNGNEPLVNFSLSSGSVDPHPTDKGHEVIFKALTAAAKVMETPTPAPTPTLTPTPPPTKTPVLVKSKDTTITSSKYKVDKVKGTIAIGNAKIALNTFKTNIKVSKGATYKILKADVKTLVVSGNVTAGMLVKVLAEDGKTFKVYKCLAR